MTTFLAIYRGATIGEAKLISVSADPELVASVAARLLEGGSSERMESEDAVLSAVANGRRRALRLVAGSTNINNGCRDEGDGE